MTGPAPRLASSVASPSGTGLLERLLAVVRPSFRADVLVFEAADAVFGGAVCLVTDCARAARSQGLCQGHHLRWKADGGPDVTVFAASTDPRWRRQQPNTRCRVDGCGYGVAADRMCVLHVQRWRRAGRPDLQAWLMDPPAVKRPVPGAVCVVEHCTLWPQADSPFCHAHHATWRADGRPAVSQFVRQFARVEVTEDQIIRLDQLTGQ